MRTLGPTALIGAVLVALTVATAAAAQTSVPVPKRAPLAKTGTTTPTTTVEVAKTGTPLSLGATTQGLPNPIIPTTRSTTSSIGQAGGTVAFDANQRGLIERVNTYLTGVQSLIGDFVQIAADGGRTEGKFYLQKPGKMRFEYNPPSPVELIADGSSLVVRDRKLASQDLYPLSQTPLRFLLADRIDLLKDTNLVGAYADDLFVTVVIEEKQVFGGTHRLMLMFGVKDFQLKQWTVTDPQGYDTTVAVYNLDNNKKLDPGLFKINYERVLQ
jgi:outer membrane lipoprotein-sorting protein